MLAAKTARTRSVGTKLTEEEYGGNTGKYGEIRGQTGRCGVGSGCKAQGDLRVMAALLGWSAARCGS
jgi:hypothetical protein